MGSSVIDAREVKVEAPQQKQYISDIYIEVIFGGEGLGLEHSGHCSKSGCNPQKLCSECGDGKSDTSSGCALFMEKFMEGSVGDVYKIHVGGSGAKMFARYKAEKGDVRSSGNGGDIMELVSKAVKSVVEYIKSLSDVSPATTNLHFYVLGFDYGAACARLFTYLLVRKKGDTLKKYETDFGLYTAKKWFVNGRLTFLEEYQDGQKIVESVGVYDTEGLIGYLGKKDGTIKIYRLE